MATVFFKRDYLAERENDYQIKHFPSVEEAEAWVSERKRKSRWFSSRHISSLDVDKMPLYLVLKFENGKYLRRLCVTEECSLEGAAIVTLCQPNPDWAIAGKSIAAYSSNGSLFSVSACAPTYIDCWVKGFETLAYVLLGGCERPLEGVDSELADRLLAAKPDLSDDVFPNEKELNQLKYGNQGKLVTKAMKQRVKELESAQKVFNEQKNQRIEAAMADWYQFVLQATL